ncbi:MAG TPA: bifunctional UDP-N-acetylmuramoyl-tripeptide:D-alanyl-D-alanine ligase/alanine racemase, partial [Cryomorphaceae bacterium]|nr:bifunctional UDP-N-acetylmuramoyl-tripeptide:D-alanyl-D-alanine ligase/alanine racemase [Cryomorphaceae bacterium]
MQYQASDIVRLLNADSLVPFPEKVISNYLFDSRRLRSVEHTLFIAIRGRQHNGHDYIVDLYEKGIRNFLVEEVPEKLKGSANFWLVEDSLQAFQTLARHTREQSKATLIAITGSNGKTIVKEWLFRLLPRTLNTAKTPKSYNSQLGVPLSVLQLNGLEDYAIFEAGISKPGEMQRLQDILQPDWGIFTNIGSAHQENFESLEQKIREKLILFKNVSGLVYRYDHNDIRSVIEDFEFTSTPELWSWSLVHEHARVRYNHDPLMEEVSFSKDGQKHIIPFPFKDEASVENALHALTTALALGFDFKEVSQHLQELEPVSMRLEQKSGRWNTVVINDAYNADLESLKIALEYFAQQLANRPKVVVLSDVLESGMDKDDLYQQISRALEVFRLDKVYTVGNDSAILSRYYSGKHEHYPSTGDFLLHAASERFQDKGILLKGARAFHFEDIDQYLTEKSHETVLEVNLSRLVDNLNFFREQLQAGVKTMAMVKAFGYGSGSYEISSLLQFHKVDYLAVAYADEGVALRKAGIEMPILVLNTELSALDDLQDFNLEPEVYSFRVLEALKEKVAASATDEVLPVHIKLETGMHRLGFEEDELPELLTRLKDIKGIRVST